MRRPLFTAFTASFATATAVAASVGLSTPLAFASTATPPVTVSGPTPFASGCNGAPQTGTNYPNTKVEPQIAINPADPNNIVAGYQQDRWSDGGANSDLAGVSHDGGATWKQVVVPHITHCAGGNSSNGGDYERATDPWVTFSPDGTLYYISQPFNSSNPTNAMSVSRSTDGGDTWSDPISLIQDTETGVLNDKVSITADPTDAHYVYATWDRLTTSKANRSAAEALHERAQASSGPTMFARTTDSGATWSTTTIFDPGQNAQTIGNQIVVLPNGTLVDAFELISNGSSSLAIITSADHGATWSGPTTVSQEQESGVTDPNTGAAIRTGGAIPEIAVDSRTGTLYLTWQDNRFSGGGHDGIAFSKSTDNGATWSAPIQVNTAPNAPAFTPTVRAGVGGSIAVSYYDFRNLAADNTTTLPTDYWLVTSSDNGATWSETHIAGSFDMFTAPNAEGYFLGDYDGLAATPTGFRPLFAATNDENLDNRTDIFTATADSTTITR
ncbi:sialidase family protein [Nocardia terpenica]|uniref:Exo-alpha-sialidase n=1 Tax=Nocardia terpenica TaxID=455432 RepID=A0A6G9Z7U2_9NOCA|nr:sialidase family protein [Nocardia terpenica]QIS21471.1 exo-alpha-sialidase [Nocardia terpenica]